MNENKIHYKDALERKNHVIHTKSCDLKTFYELNYEAAKFFFERLFSKKGKCMPGLSYK
ncbi:hypothetical protein [Ruminococcus albus]|uniref:hypothetical protein n=1 Tax=Ruminococcus albus TaxID=1264 RepID=UPI0004B4E0C1|nr:hypothetical protein [Ruminococcus albus]